MYNLDMGPVFQVTVAQGVGNALQLSELGVELLGDVWNQSLVLL